MTTAEPIMYRVSDGSGDHFTNYVCRTDPGGKWYVRTDLHPSVTAYLERNTGNWLPTVLPPGAKVSFDTSEEAIAAAVRKHDEERERL